MAFQCRIDEFGTQAAARSGVLSVAQGSSIQVSGWVVDADRATVPRRVFGIVDDTLIVHATTIVRHDVSTHFGNAALADCGFAMAIDTADLVPKQHLLSVVAEDADGSLYRVEQRPFDVTAPEASPATFPRVIVSGAPKSGSTYTWLVLTKYFGTQELTPGALFRGTQPLLDDWALERLRGRAYVVHMHLFPNALNLRAIADEAIVPVVLWRNLADAIVSNDDHLRRLHEISPEPDGEKYAAMDAQARYRFLIRFRLAEFISFYLGWRRAGVPLFHFEDMIAGESAYFERIISRIGGSVDAQRLAAARAAAGSESQSRQNKNVGTTGRSLTAFDDETKALLEETLRAYYEPLDDLLAELPWR
ncbi:MAG TPA: hypothetical protein VMD47_01395 [Candidatus Acidoferrales bacterium]|nr:hypothetical protein [Candidatus Acidoferrales bacterium]